MKTLLLKLGLGTLAVVFLQFRLGGIIEFAPCAVRDGMDDQLRAGGRTLVLGDSVQGTVQLKDPEQRSLARMLEERLPPRSLIQVYSLAYAAEVHRAAAAYVFRSGAKLDAVVVGINMRSFGPL